MRTRTHKAYYMQGYMQALGGGGLKPGESKIQCCFGSKLKLKIYFSVLFSYQNQN